MKIKFLGSAAYDAIPAPFCTCDTCRRSRLAGGRNIRTRMQALLNDDLLLDFNADTIAHFFQNNIDSSKIKYCLITHSHSDHLYVPDILIPQYSTTAAKVHYYASKSGYDMIKKGIEETFNMDRFAEAHQISAYQHFQCGEYKVLSLEANHDQNSTPVFYAIEKEGKRILYAHDTGVFYDTVYSKLKEFGRLDLISIDCTGALRRDYRNGHMCLETNIEVLTKLHQIGVIDDNTILVLNHFSHNGEATYDDLLKHVPKNMIVGYDGLTLEF